MPSGFIGAAAKAYLTHSAQSMERAVSTNNDVRIKRLGESPFPPEQANRGAFKTGVGNSSNVVVDAHAYANAMQMLSRIDDDVSYMLYHMCEELEEMCRTAFVVPRTSARLLMLCGRVKNSMHTYRRLTDNIVTGTNRFVQDMINIDVR